MVSRLLEEIAGTSFEIGSWMWVDVVHVNNPHSFYVRPRTYSKYLPLLQAAGTRPEPSEMKLGDIFVFNSHKLHCIVRGKIVNCEYAGKDSTYKFFAVDIGCTEDGIPLDRIWTTLYPLEVPSLITHCQLADCVPRGETWEDDAIHAMRNYVEGERAKIIVRNKTANSIIVELYNSRPDDISTLLALTNHSALGHTGASASNLETPHWMNPSYAVRPVEVGEAIHVRMQSGVLLEHFFVTPVDEYLLYLADRDNYTLHARSQKEVIIEELRLNAPIGVYYQKNNKFERGLVKELYPQTNKAKLQLVDLGITIEESVTKMKTIPDWYLRVPTRALFCTLHSSQIVRDNLVMLSFPGVEFLITIKAIGNDRTSAPHSVVVTQLEPREIQASYLAHDM